MDIDLVLLRLCCVHIIQLCAESAKDTSIVLILAGACKKPYDASRQV